jgi:hypothetical protein
MYMGYPHNCYSCGNRYNSQDPANEESLTMTIPAITGTIHAVINPATFNISVLLPGSGANKEFAEQLGRDVSALTGGDVPADAIALKLLTNETLDDQKHVTDRSSSCPAPAPGPPRPRPRPAAWLSATERRLPATWTLLPGRQPSARSPPLVRCRKRSPRAAWTVRPQPWAEPPRPAGAKAGGAPGDQVTMASLVQHTASMALLKIRLPFARRRPAASQSSWT